MSIPMQQLTKPTNLVPFVKDIFYLENTEQSAEVNIPIYADGFPGIMYSETHEGILLKPKNKWLSQFYLYGQTIEPITLTVKPPFRIIVFQLYPFASRLLLGVNPKELNDDCYDLLALKNFDVSAVLHQLQDTATKTDQLTIIADFIRQLVPIAAINTDYRIKLAINLILSAKGYISIKEVREQLGVTERTLERQFKKEVGVSPKQFARIIQFNFSLNRLTNQLYTSLTELSYDIGFSDQSHFIRTFKRYTGKTPKEFKQFIN